LGTGRRKRIEIADVLIVGTSFKRDGITANPVDRERVRMFMEAVRKVRAGKA
jgi:predicted TIM-barrel enzyme